MGYYVRIKNSTAVIREKNLAEAYELMCELNKDDSKKNGGSWGGGGKQASWFSWMPENYPETCKTAQEIIEELGFDCSVDEETGDLEINWYDSKIGQEDLFFEAIGHLVEGIIEWVGEDGDVWAWKFDENGYNYLAGKIVYE